MINSIFIIVGNYKATVIQQFVYAKGNTLRLRTSSKINYIGYISFNHSKLNISKNHCRDIYIERESELAISIEQQLYTNPLIPMITHYIIEHPVISVLEDV